MSSRIAEKYMNSFHLSSLGESEVVDVSNISLLDNPSIKNNLLEKLSKNKPGELILENCQLTDNLVMEISKYCANNKNLRYLNLKNNNLTSKSGYYLLDLLKQNRSIESVTIFSNPIFQENTNDSTTIAQQIRQYFQETKYLRSICGCKISYPLLLYTYQWEKRTEMSFVLMELQKNTDLKLFSVSFTKQQQHHHHHHRSSSNPFPTLSLGGTDIFHDLCITLLQNNKSLLSLQCYEMMSFLLTKPMFQHLFQHHSPTSAGTDSTTATNKTLKTLQLSIAREMSVVQVRLLLIYLLHTLPWFTQLKTFQWECAYFTAEELLSTSTSLLSLYDEANHTNAATVLSTREKEWLQSYQTYSIFDLLNELIKSSTFTHLALYSIPWNWLLWKKLNQAIQENGSVSLLAINAYDELDYKGKELLEKTTTNRKQSLVLRVGENERLYGSQYATESVQQQQHKPLADIWQVGDMVEALIDDNNNWLKAIVVAISEDWKYSLLFPTPPSNNNNNNNGNNNNTNPSCTLKTNYRAQLLRRGTHFQRPSRLLLLENLVFKEKEEHVAVIESTPTQAQVNRVERRDVSGIQTISSDVMNAPFDIGEQVYYRYAGDSTFLLVSIVEVLSCQNTSHHFLYTIQLMNGSAAPPVMNSPPTILHEIEAHSLLSRPVYDWIRAKKSSYLQFYDSGYYQRGDYVEIYSDSYGISGYGGWKRGRIASDKKNGCYDIRMENGADESNVPGRYLKYHFRVKDSIDYHVEHHYNLWKLGKIMISEKVNGETYYTIQYYHEAENIIVEQQGISSSLLMPIQREIVRHKRIDFTTQLNTLYEEELQRIANIAQTKRIAQEQEEKRKKRAAEAAAIPIIQHHITPDRPSKADKSMDMSSISDTSTIYEPGTGSTRKSAGRKHHSSHSHSRERERTHTTTPSQQPPTTTTHEEEHYYEHYRDVPHNDHQQQQQQQQNMMMIDEEEEELLAQYDRLTIQQQPQQSEPRVEEEEETPVVYRSLYAQQRQSKPSSQLIYPPPKKTMTLISPPPRQKNPTPSPAQPQQQQQYQQPSFQQQSLQDYSFQQPLLTQQQQHHSLQQSFEQSFQQHAFQQQQQQSMLHNNTPQQPHQQPQQQQQQVSQVIRYSSPPMRSPYPMIESEPVTDTPVMTRYHSPPRNTPSSMMHQTPASSRQQGAEYDYIETDQDMILSQTPHSLPASSRIYSNQGDFQPTPAQMMTYQRLPTARKPQLTPARPIVYYQEEASSFQYDPSMISRRDESMMDGAYDSLADEDIRYELADTSVYAMNKTQLQNLHNSSVNLDSTIPSFLMMERQRSATKRPVLSAKKSVKEEIQVSLPAVGSKVYVLDKYTGQSKLYTVIEVNPISQTLNVKNVFDEKEVLIDVDPRLAIPEQALMQSSYSSVWKVHPSTPAIPQSNQDNVVVQNSKPMKPASATKASQADSKGDRNAPRNGFDWKVGNRVKVFLAEENTWYTGVITKIPIDRNEDDSYHVVLDHEEFERLVTVDCLQPIKSKSMHIVHEVAEAKEQMIKSVRPEKENHKSSESSSVSPLRQQISDQTSMQPSSYVDDERKTVAEPKPVELPVKQVLETMQPLQSESKGLSRKATIMENMKVIYQASNEQSFVQECIVYRITSSQDCTLQLVGTNELIERVNFDKLIPIAMPITTNTIAKESVVVKETLPTVQQPEQPPFIQQQAQQLQQQQSMPIQAFPQSTVQLLPPQQQQYVQPPFTQQQTQQQQQQLLQQQHYLSSTQPLSQQPAALSQQPAFYQSTPVAIDAAVPSSSLSMHDLAASYSAFPNPNNVVYPNNNGHSNHNLNGNAYSNAVPYPNNNTIPINNQTNYHNNNNNNYNPFPDYANNQRMMVTNDRPLSHFPQQQQQYFQQLQQSQQQEQQTVLTPTRPARPPRSAPSPLISNANYSEPNMEPQQPFRSVRPLSQSTNAMSFPTMPWTDDRPNTFSTTTAALMRPNQNHPRLRVQSLPFTVQSNGEFVGRLEYLLPVSAATGYATSDLWYPVVISLDYLPKSQQITSQLTREIKFTVEFHYDPSLYQINVTSMNYEVNSSGVNSGKTKLSLVWKPSSNSASQLIFLQPWSSQEGNQQQRLTSAPAVTVVFYYDYLLLGMLTPPTVFDLMSSSLQSVKSSSINQTIQTILTPHCLQSLPPQIQSSMQATMQYFPTKNIQTQYQPPVASRNPTKATPTAIQLVLWDEELLNTPWDNLSAWYPFLLTSPAVMTTPSSYYLLRSSNGDEEHDNKDNSKTVLLTVLVSRIEYLQEVKQYVQSLRLAGHVVISYQLPDLITNNATTNNATNAVHDTLIQSWSRIQSLWKTFFPPGTFLWPSFAIDNKQQQQQHWSNTRQQGSSGEVRYEALKAFLLQSLSSSSSNSMLLSDWEVIVPATNATITSNNDSNKQSYLRMTLSLSPEHVRQIAGYMKYLLGQWLYYRMAQYLTHIAPSTATTATATTSVPSYSLPPPPSDTLPHLNTYLHWLLRSYDHNNDSDEEERRLLVSGIFDISCLFLLYDYFDGLIATNGHHQVRGSSTERIQKIIASSVYQSIYSNSNANGNGNNGKGNGVVLSGRRVEVWRGIVSRNLDQVSGVMEGYNDDANGWQEMGQRVHTVCEVFSRLSLSFVTFSYENTTNKMEYYLQKQWWSRLCNATGINISNNSNNHYDLLITPINTTTNSNVSYRPLSSTSTTNNNSNATNTNNTNNNTNNNNNTTFSSQQFPLPYHNNNNNNNNNMQQTNTIRPGTANGNGNGINNNGANGMLLERKRERMFSEQERDFLSHLQQLLGSEQGMNEENTMAYEVFQVLVSQGCNNWKAFLTIRSSLLFTADELNFLNTTNTTANSVISKNAALLSMVQTIQQKAEQKGLSFFSEALHIPMFLAMKLTHYLVYCL